MGSDSTPYVSEKSFQQAREFEQRLQDLPKEAGILFVGVQAYPEAGGDSREFHFTLGIDRKFEEETLKAVLRKTFEKEIEDGYFIITSRIYRGICGAAAH